MCVLHTRLLFQRATGEREVLLVESALCCYNESNIRKKVCSMLLLTTRFLLPHYLGSLVVSRSNEQGESRQQSHPETQSIFPSTHLHPYIDRTMFFPSLSTPRLLTGCHPTRREKGVCPFESTFLFASLNRIFRTLRRFGLQERNTDRQSRYNINFF